MHHRCPAVPHPQCSSVADQPWIHGRPRLACSCSQHCCRCRCSAWHAVQGKPAQLPAVSPWGAGSTPMHTPTRMHWSTHPTRRSAVQAARLAAGGTVSGIIKLLPLEELQPCPLVCPWAAQQLQVRAVRHGRCATWSMLHRPQASDESSSPLPRSAQLPRASPETARRRQPSAVRLACHSTRLDVGISACCAASHLPGHQPAPWRLAHRWRPPPLPAPRNPALWSPVARPDRTSANASAVDASHRQSEHTPGRRPGAAQAAAAGLSHAACRAPLVAARAADSSPPFHLCCQAAALGSLRESPALLEVAPSGVRLC